MILVAAAFALVAFGRRRSTYARLALGIALGCAIATAVFPTIDALVRVSIAATFAAALVLLVVAYRDPA